MPTILGIIPYAGTSFFIYGTLKPFIKGNLIIDYTEIIILSTILFGTEKHGYENTLVNLSCGAVAGMAGQSTSYPLDIIRRKMQTSIITGKNYTNLRTTVIIIYK